MLKSIFKGQKVLTALIFLTLVSCESPSEESEPIKNEANTSDENTGDRDTSSQTKLCSYKGGIAYSIGIDVTSNFDVSNQIVRNTILASNCEGIQANSYYDDNFDRVTRVAKTLSIIDQQSLNQLAILADNLVELPQSGNIDLEDGTTLGMKFTYAELNAEYNQFIVLYEAEFYKNAKNNIQTEKMDTEEILKVVTKSFF